MWFDNVYTASKGCLASQISRPLPARCADGKHLHDHRKNGCQTISVKHRVRDEPPRHIPQLASAIPRTLVARGVAQPCGERGGVRKRARPSPTASAFHTAGRARVNKMPRLWQVGSWLICWAAGFLCSCVFCVVAQDLYFGTARSNREVTHGCVLAVPFFAVGSTLPPSGWPSAPQGVGRAFFRRQQRRPWERPKYADDQTHPLVDPRRRCEVVARASRIQDP